MSGSQIYFFGCGTASQDLPSPKQIGVKAHGLLVMAQLGLPVPAGFIVAPGTKLALNEIETALDTLQQALADVVSPRLFALRFSQADHARTNQPAILNIGLHDENFSGFAEQIKDLGEAQHRYATYLASYAVQVWGRDAECLEELGLNDDGHFKSATDRLAAYKKYLAEHAASSLPMTVAEQLFHLLHHSQQHACIVQVMLLADIAPASAMSRDAATGQSLSVYDPLRAGQYPDAMKMLDLALVRLERHLQYPQQLHYCTAQGQLWLMKTMQARISARAELKFLVDLVQSDIISRETALMRIDPRMIEQFLHPTLDSQNRKAPYAIGIAASPGAVVGHIAFDAEAVQLLKTQGKTAILLRSETSPEDIQAMHVAEAVVTARGGMLSHAAVIARGMGKPCVAGASSLRIDYGAGFVMSEGVALAAGDLITVDGSTGKIYQGEIATVKPVLSGDFATVLEWADQVRRMKVRANAETPHDARAARYYGAEGIGLCRTEHMFFSAERIGAMRRMILAETAQDRRAALAQIFPMQRQDFTEIFEIMVGLPVTIRLLDPPLHEFLPKSDGDIAELAVELSVPVETLRSRVQELQELNPMLGHRGVRLAISYPEIAEMQARAIFEAAIVVGRKYGTAPIPEIMIPLVMDRAEFDFVRARIISVADSVQQEHGFLLPYLVGTMVELPRAALMAGEIAQSAEFFSFGTNDLTQTTLGISRDDSARFISEYIAKGVLKEDPFVTIDRRAVGELVRFAALRGRESRSDIKLGMCGEHAGDPASIGFCESVNLDYISCSPFRIAIARLAAAQASIGKI